jgi:hypothetical protein
MTNGTGQNDNIQTGPSVRFGSKADLRPQFRDVCFASTLIE